MTDIWVWPLPNVNNTENKDMGLLVGQILSRMLLFMQEMKPSSPAIYHETFKDTWYLWGKNSENRQLLDILTCNSANVPSFQNPWLFVRFRKDGLLAKLWTKTSRSCRFSLFLPHKYQVSLTFHKKETSDHDSYVPSCQHHLILLWYSYRYCQRINFVELDPELTRSQMSVYDPIEEVHIPSPLRGVTLWQCWQESQ